MTRCTLSSQPLLLVWGLTRRMWDWSFITISCTCAFGMGVDKKNVRTVIHRDVPLTAESFIQESGRGARDGGIADSFLLWNYSDYQKFSSFPFKSRERVLLDFAQSKTCRRQILLDALGAEQAACSGCDICKAQGKLSGETNKNEMPALLNGYTDAWDRNFALKHLSYYSKSWDKEYAASFLKEKLNEISVRNFGIKIWQISDVIEIFDQLLSEQKIFICRWPFKNKIATAKNRNFNSETG